MDELVTWLRQQLDEDEWVARKCNPQQHREIVTEVLARKSIGTHHHAMLIAVWEPARVLAEVEAKRRILERALAWAKQAERTPVEVRHVATASGDAWLEALELLAQPYAGRPGWREEWRAA